MISAKQGLEAVTLKIQDGDGNAFEYKLRDDSGAFVGKSTNCVVQISNPELNDIHCRIALERGRLWVQDWMSTQGTYLNGHLIDAQTDVNVGDVIKIGRTYISVHAEYQASDSESSHLSYIDNDSPTTLTAPSDDEGDDQVYLQTGETDGSFCQAATNDLTPQHRSEPAAFDMSFAYQDAVTYDHETVALLRAEIEVLQSALAQRDAESTSDQAVESRPEHSVDASSDPTDKILHRMQDLIDEMNRSDERVCILEELLHAAEDTHQAEQEERTQLHAWVSDIEICLGQRDEEYAAEIEALRQRLDESLSAQNHLQRQLQEAAFNGSVPQQYEQSLQNLQSSNLQLQKQLAQSQKQCIALDKRVEELSGEQERSLREERIHVAQEQAKLARMRFELSKKLIEVEELPRATSAADAETSHRIRALREHLLEIHEQEKQAEKEASLTTRLSRLWKRTEPGQNG